MNAIGSTYALGHDNVEVQRLLLQGRLYNDHAVITMPPLITAWARVQPADQSERQMA
jgi:hypothetical protein